MFFSMFKERKAKAGLYIPGVVRPRYGILCVEDGIRGR